MYDRMVKDIDIEILPGGMFTSIQVLGFRQLFRYDKLECSPL